MGEIIAIANQNTNVGKTITAINLSLFLAMESKKVLLVDLDLNDVSTYAFGIDENISNGIYNALVEGIDIKELIIKTEYNNLMLIPNNQKKLFYFDELNGNEDREIRLKKSIDPIIDDFDYIIIDCPSSLDILTINALITADSLIIPIPCSGLALNGLSEFLQTIHLIQKGMNPDLFIRGVLITMYKKNQLSDHIVDEAVKSFKDKVYNTVIPLDNKLFVTENNGKVNFDIESVGAKNYKKLAMELINHG